MSQVGSSVPQKGTNCHSYHLILRVVIIIIWYDSNLNVVAQGLTQLFEVYQRHIMSIIRPLKVVGRVSGTQLQVGEISIS